MLCGLSEHLKCKNTFPVLSISHSYRQTVINCIFSEILFFLFETLLLYLCMTHSLYFTIIYFTNLITFLKQKNKLEGKSPEFLFGPNLTVNISVIIKLLFTHKDQSQSRENMKVKSKS